MNQEEIKKIVSDAVQRELKKVTGFRTWRKYDSVTDIYSPITGNSAQIGFYGTPKIAKPTVTGSAGANAALTSLLTALANLGLITNSSS